MTSAGRLQGQSYFYENNIFEQVKNQVTARSAAEFYGIRVGRNGMACCPFHDDNHASAVAFNNRFYCSACGINLNRCDFVMQVTGSKTKNEMLMNLKKIFNIQ